MDTASTSSPLSQDLHSPPLPQPLLQFLTYLPLLTFIYHCSLTICGHLLISEFVNFTCFATYYLQSDGKRVPTSRGGASVAPGRHFLNVCS